MKKLILIACLSLPACSTLGVQGSKWDNAEKHYYQAENKCLDLLTRKKLKNHAEVAECVSDRTSSELKYAAHEPKIIDNYMKDLKAIGVAVDKKKLSVQQAKIQRGVKWAAVQKSVGIARQKRHALRGVQKGAVVEDNKVQQEEINQQMLDTLNSPINSSCTNTPASSNCVAR